MIKSIRIALAQMNPTVGAIEHNTSQIIEHIAEARRHKTNLILFPELAVTGYPPEDLVLRQDFIQANIAGVNKIAEASTDILTIVGFIEKVKDNEVYNAAAICAGGKIIATYRKICLPNYGVFDERRYFATGKSPLVIEWKKLKIGVSICEDIWTSAQIPELEAGVGEAQLIVNLSASPYHFRKGIERQRLLAQIAQRSQVCFAYVNMVGGQDEIVFDGQAFIHDASGKLLLRSEQFKEQLIVTDIEIPVNVPKSNIALQNTYPLNQCQIPIPFIEHREILNTPQIAQLRNETEEVFTALKLGTRDYITKNGFKKVVIGLSGGIDSALTAAIAVPALGKENVVGVFMPSRFTSTISKEDAEALADNLGIDLITLPIQEIAGVFDKTLSSTFSGLQEDITEENIQARIRGTLLMALSNKFDWLVLATSNKSETAVGYSTLYGDMVGGFSIIKDVPKTVVYQLARWINQQAGTLPPIPARTIERPPTAELRPDQKDEDSLPPYDLLDQIIEDYVEEDRSVDELVAKGVSKTIVTDMIKLIDRAEYKRSQGAPGIKISTKNFGKDRRMPITNRFKPYEITS